MGLLNVHLCIYGFFFCVFAFKNAIFRLKMCSFFHRIFQLFRDNNFKFWVPLGLPSPNENPAYAYGRNCTAIIYFIMDISFFPVLFWANNQPDCFKYSFVVFIQICPFFIESMIIDIKNIKLIRLIEWLKMYDSN